MAVIKDLPPELLLQVFLQACRGDYDSWCNLAFNRPAFYALQSRQDEFPFAYSWIYVTHVCRLWRDIALSYPGLWNNIVVSWAGPARDVEFLRRSKDLSLTISVAWIPEYENDFPPPLYLTHLADDRGRVESLLTALVSGNIVAFALAAPALRQLHFSSSYALDGFFSAFPSGQALSQLEYLEAPLSRFPQNSAMSALKTLAMRISLATWIVHITEPGLLQTFNHFTQLEVLQIDIDDVDGYEDDDDRVYSPVTPTAIVHFPALQNLKLEVHGCSVSPCIWILEHLRIPRTTRVSVCATPYPTDTFASVALNSVLYSLPYHPPTRHVFLPMLSCSISSTMGIIELRGWYTEQPVANAAVRPAATPDPDVVLSLSTLQLSQDEIQRFWQTFPTCNARSLRLGPTSIRDISMTDYLRSSSSGGAVRALTIVGMLGPLVLDILSAARSAEEVSLVECDFSPRGVGEDMWLWSWEPST